jgi:hypothetical protein
MTDRVKGSVSTGLLATDGVGYRRLGRSWPGMEGVSIGERGSADWGCAHERAETLDKPERRCGYGSTAV